MRTIILAGLAAIFIQTTASAETCETLDIRDSYGTIVSTSQVCVDDSGSWAAPQPVASVPSAQGEIHGGIDASRVMQMETYTLDTSPARTASNSDSMKSSGWKPTSGSAKRQALYAKLGLVCVARKAMFCGSTPCSGRCEGKQGWCDGRTGELYESLEAMERAYCKPKRR